MKPGTYMDVLAFIRMVLSLLNAFACILLHLVNTPDSFLVLCASSGVAATSSGEVRCCHIAAWSRGVAACSRVIAAVFNHTPDE